jgi:hypothetical protein
VGIDYSDMILRGINILVAYAFSKMMFNFIVIIGLALSYSMMCSGKMGFTVILLLIIQFYLIVVIQMHYNLNYTLRLLFSFL